MLVDSSVVSPTVTELVTSTAIASASANKARGTNMREGALQDCPVLLYMCKTPPVTAALRSASAKTILGDLPPSS